MAQQPYARIAVVVGATAAIALSLCACGSGRRPAAPVNSAARSSVMFARCMRANGVPRWPDPTSSGGFDKPQLTPVRLDASVVHIQTAGAACEQLLPQQPAGNDAAYRLLVEMRDFAVCVRGHGVPRWPDPIPDVPGKEGYPGFPSTLNGIDQRAPRVIAAIDGCRHLIPGASRLSPGGYP